jgi:nitrile hydratase accessory protein
VSERAAAVEALEGPLALPRSNGELAFEAPWQGRAFGLAVALCEQGAFAWETFRQELIAAIAAGEPAGEPYWESWLTALSAVLLGGGLLERDELAARVAELRSGARDEVH